MSEPIATWIVDEALNKQVIRLNNIFKTFGKDIREGLSGALTRAASAAQAETNRAVPKHYAIAPGKFRQHVKFSPNGLRTSGDLVIMSYRYAGNVIPLLEYNGKVDANRSVSAAVKKGRGPVPLTIRTFGANLYGKEAVFQRLTEKRFPIRQIFGPAAPSLVKNEKVTEAFEKKAIETLMTRMDHELSRIFSR